MFIFSSLIEPKLSMIESVMYEQGTVFHENESELAIQVGFDARVD